MVVIDEDGDIMWGTMNVCTKTVDRPTSIAFSRDMSLWQKINYIVLFIRTGGRRASVWDESSAVGHSCVCASEIHRRGGEGPCAALIIGEGTAPLLLF